MSGLKSVKICMSNDVTFVAQRLRHSMIMSSYDKLRWDYTLWKSVLRQAFQLKHSCKIAF